MDDEELLMVKNIKSKNANVANQPECIKNLHITWGDQESDYFKKQNDHLKDKGLPYFVKMQRSIGNQLYLWSQSSFDNRTFVTNIELSHKDPSNELHRNPVDMKV